LRVRAACEVDRPATELRYSRDGEVGMNVRSALVLAMGLGVGCGSSGGSGGVVDFTGAYSGTSINGQSSCPGTWNTGQMGDGAVNLAQSGDDVQFQGQGGTAVVFLTVFGATGFTGKASGSVLDAVVVGSIPQAAGACTYTWKGTITASLSGDVLSGKLTYTPNSNGHADCDTQKVTGCSRVTDFTYKRPPKQSFDPTLARRASD
jgi:hypothetical protein